MPKKVSREKLEAAKRASTAQLLFKCARLLNEKALASFPRGPDEFQPRAAHMALFAHLDTEGIRPTLLAQRVGISKQAVGQLLDDLEGAGVVERVPDPDDGRAKLVRFTTDGWNGILMGLDHLRSIEKQIAKSIGIGTMRDLHQALLALHDHLDPD